MTTCPRCGAKTICIPCRSYVEDLASKGNMLMNEYWIVKVIRGKNELLGYDNDFVATEREFADKFPTKALAQAQADKWTPYGDPHHLIPRRGVVVHVHRAPRRDRYTADAKLLGALARIALLALNEKVLEEWEHDLPPDWRVTVGVWAKLGI